MVFNTKDPCARILVLIVVVLVLLLLQYNKSKLEGGYRPNVSRMISGGSKGEVVKLTSDNAEQIKNSGPVIVKFFAPWCGHCIRMADTWKELAKNSPSGVTVAEVDMTTDADVAKIFGLDVKGFPTIIMFHPEKGAIKHEDERTVSNFKSFINKCLNS